MKVRIKTGAVIWQDFSFYEWTDNGEIFDIENVVFSGKDTVSLKAYGYGLLGQYRKDGTYDDKAYGNGGLFVDKKDLILMDDLEIERGI
jgi:hypothetical protein